MSPHGGGGSLQGERSGAFFTFRALFPLFAVVMPREQVLKTLCRLVCGQQKDKYKEKE